MLIIEHRKNTSLELTSVPFEHGVEIDVRSRGDKLILHHDAFCEGEDLQEWLKSYKHKILIVNTKEEGLEEKIRGLLTKFDVKAYFFLDLSFPFLIKWANQGEKNIAVRFSEHESVETCLAVKNMVKWVWVDCFSKMPLNPQNYRQLKECFSLCVVSPELLGRGAEEVRQMRMFFKDYPVDAVCTKHPEVWNTK